ncbi:MAG: allantoinase AllB [Gemmatimonadaceae bacterium]|nr:allantoinase AllB [Gemmatimonadaceae bacterium]
MRGRRVLTPDGVHPATVHIESGRIARVASWDDIGSGARCVDAGDMLVMPGIVDTHVHVNEPGRTNWEGFESATHAAAAGGVTTILDMPLNSIPATTSVKALEVKRAAAEGKTSVNVEFIGGVVPGNTGELEGLRDSGVRAFKCFLSPSGVDEFPHMTERDLAKAFPVLARLGLPLMVHAEDPARLVAAGSSSSYADYLASRPIEAEHSAIELLVGLMNRSRAHVHIVHLSSATSLEIIRAAKRRGLPLTVETCPHYLTFAAEDIPDGATEYKCAPPIRSRAERDALWDALIAGDIDLVASDHSPCPPNMKRTHGDFFSAWGGIASLQLSLPAVCTGARVRDVPPERIAEWMSAAPARLAGLGDRKGAIAEGYDADIVLWDPDESFVVDPAKLFHRHTVTPYAGRELFGVVHTTYVGGRQVFGDRLAVTNH